MFCQKCGNKVKENARFCSCCGAHCEGDMQYSDSASLHAAASTAEQQETMNNSSPQTPIRNSTSNNGKLKMMLIFLGIFAIAAVLAVVVAALAKQKSNNSDDASVNGSLSTSSLFSSSSSNFNKNTEAFKDVLAEYNTYYSQGNSVGYMNSNSVNTNWSKLIKPVCDELRSEGFQYLPAEKNDLPVSYCFRDVDGDNQNEMIVKAQHYGVLGVYYRNADSGEISFDSHFCDKTVPMDYDDYEVYLSEDGKLVEYAGLNDKAYVRDLSAQPATNEVEIWRASDNSTSLDLKGNIAGSGTFLEMIEKMKAAYPKDESVEWIKFDGQNGKPAKSVEEWWLTRSPVLTGTLKWVSYVEAAKMSGRDAPPEFNTMNDKILVFVTDEDVTFQAGNYKDDPLSATGRVFRIIDLDTWSSKNVPTNYFGSETYGSWENKRVKLIFNKANTPSDVCGVCYKCIFTGVRCAVVE